jgi:hypothetical protein
MQCWYVDWGEIRESMRPISGSQWPAFVPGNVLAGNWEAALFVGDLMASPHPMATQPISRGKDRSCGRERSRWDLVPHSSGAWLLGVALFGAVWLVMIGAMMPPTTTSMVRYFWVVTARAPARCASRVAGLERLGSFGRERLRSGRPAGIRRPTSDRVGRSRRSRRARPQQA